ncbi:MAG: hypothetical protein NC244_07785 [Alistipes senegalensis]|nr:hypothetical protein [Alistipes senegalensis]
MENIKHMSLPVNYAIDTSFKNDKFIKLRLDFAHDGVNYNRTYFDKATLENKKNSLFLSPLLGHIKQDQDGNYDFGGHDIEFIPNPYQDNKIQQVYLETILGIIPPEEYAEFEIKEVDGKSRVFVNGFLYKNYSNFAEDILKQNVKTAVSMETEILKYSYSIQEDVYNIQDFEYTGITFLGRNCNPAMVGANAQFYEQNRLNNVHEQMNVILQDLKSVFSLEDNNKNQNEGGTQIMGENNATPLEQITETETVKEDLTAVDGSVQAEKDAVPAANTADADDTETKVATEDNTSDISEKQTFTKVFEISHEDIRWGLYQALAVVESTDNTEYWIDEVYDGYFDYSTYSQSNTCYRQHYTVSDNEVTFTGERIEMFIEKLTSAERTALNTMRSTYETQSAELNELRAFKSNYDMANKQALIDKWEEKIGTCQEFVDLKANYSEKSIDEIEVKCKCIFADNNAFMKVKAPSGTYSKKISEFTPITVPVHEETEPKQPKAYNGFIEEYSSINN